MSKHAALALIALVVLPTQPSAADQLSKMQLAMSLGSVLAAEEPCGFSYDQAAIRAFIAKNVSADDMQFPQFLNGYTSSYLTDLGSMTASQKTAACSQIERVARSNNFLR